MQRDGLDTGNSDRTPPRPPDVRIAGRSPVANQVIDADCAGGEDVGIDPIRGHGSAVGRKSELDVRISTRDVILSHPQQRAGTRRVQASGAGTRTPRSSVSCSGAANGPISAAGGALPGSAIPLRGDFQSV